MMQVGIGGKAVVEEVQKLTGKLHHIHQVEPGMSAYPCPLKLTAVFLQVEVMLQSMHAQQPLLKKCTKN